MGKRWNGTRRGLGAGLGLLFVLSPPAATEAQEAQVSRSSVAISSQAGGRLELELELADGSEHVIAFRDGTVRADGRSLGSYEPGGALEEAWRQFLRRHGGGSPEELAAALAAWRPSPLTGSEAAAAGALAARLGQILGLAPPEAPDAPRETVTVTGPDGTQLAIAPGPLSFEALTEQLSRLQASLRELGEAAAGAEERFALIVHDDFDLPADRVVPGSLALLGGTLRLAGTVRGDALVLDGTLVLEPSARIEGNVLQVGGAVEEAGGRIAGELLSIRPTAPRAAPAPPAAVPAPDKPARARTARARQRDLGFFGSAARNVGRAVGGLTGTVSALLALGVLGLIAVYFGRPQLELVADTARFGFGRAFLMGLAGQILFLPAVIVLAVTVIGIPLAVLLVPATALALVAGYLAAAHALGEVFAARRYRYQWLERLRRSNSYYYVLSGLALLLLPFAIHAALWLLGGLGGFLRGLTLFAGCVVTWAAATAGFGAVLLTRGGTRGDELRAAWRAAGGGAWGAEAPATGGEGGSGG